ncbi:hypothetical protein VCRA2110O182_200029 [Vibrio crassostreae]|nr:hypothetical protein VCRA2110O182_200029 [Vibrio crassostreae]CAK2306081.1 hypothetical protein VCRA2111O408_200066 [Vibrio crassostreae]
MKALKQSESFFALKSYNESSQCVKTSQKIAQIVLELYLS